MKTDAKVDEQTAEQEARSLRTLQTEYPALYAYCAGLSNWDRYYSLTHGGDWPEDH